MERSESIKELCAALTEFHKEVKAVGKDAVNPYFKSKYATLDSIWSAVRPLLAKNGLTLTQFPTEIGLTSMLMHTSGEFIAQEAKMIVKDATPQGQGSALTYMRRYAMSAILGIVTEDDDDGNQATKETKPDDGDFPGF